MMYWIYDYPSWLIGVLFVCSLIAVTWAGIFLTRATVHSWIHRQSRANEMVGLALSSFCVMFGLLLGLVAIATYTNFAAVGTIVDQEASSLSSLWKEVSSFPQPIRGQLQSALREYARYTIQEGWAEQRRGIVPQGEPQRSAAISKVLLSFEPSTEREKILFAATLQESTHRIQLSRARMSNVVLGLPAVFWSVVAFCTLLNIILIWMQDMEIHVHLILGSVLAAVLGAIIFLIAELDNPFRGTVSIGPDSIAHVFENVMKPSVMNQKAENPMAYLVAMAMELGPPRIVGRTSVAGTNVPDLFFGKSEMNNASGIVDKIVKKQGATASVFVRSGDAYVRVATNVKNADGSRALGTVLDPKGPVVEQINSGEAFYGKVAILGKPYMTGYEPIRDASGQVIGIFGVAYPESSSRG
jgi:hypothetical protein